MPPPRQRQRLSSLLAAATAPRPARTGVSSASGASCRARRRPFSSTWTCQRDPGAPKPPPSGPGPNTDDNGSSPDEPDSLFGTDATRGGRTRQTAGSSMRSRIPRRRDLSPLPPVHLSARFTQDCYYPHTSWPHDRRSIPMAMAREATQWKTSKIHTKGDADGKIGTSNEMLVAYFGSWSKALRENINEDIKQMLRTDPWNFTPKDGENLEGIIRMFDRLIDASWHLADALYPARHAEYDYQVRPFWWWHLHTQRALLNEYDFAKKADQVPFGMELQGSMREAKLLDPPLSHSLADLPWGVYQHVRSSVQAALLQTAPATFDPKTSRRPISIVTTTGTSSRAINESLAANIAAVLELDLIRLDAWELSQAVGQYIDQDWAHARGTMSMLGFRAAELGGRIIPDPYAKSRPPVFPEEDDGDDASSPYFRTSLLGKDLDKIRQGDFDAFSAWDIRRIDNILESIINMATSNEKGVLVHVNDFVEMSMTLDGAYVVSRLRTLVDTAWQQGKKIVLLGTSSVKETSADYQSMVSELSTEDLVISRQLRPHQRELYTKGLKPMPMPLDSMDNLVENLQNVERMMGAIQPDVNHRVDIEKVLSQGVNTAGNHDLARGLLPLPEIYAIASQFLALWSQEPEKTPTTRPNIVSHIMMTRGQLGRIRHDPGAPRVSSSNASLAEAAMNEAKTDNAEAAAESLGQLTDYEKRVSSGQINKEDLKVTFADVHVPKETKSTLKLLTSLALQRPDAFSYGVLATDKISGCLLYGPPGTGKTMLAKAVAKDSGANMLEISGASINSKWVGESEKLIRATFSLARKLSPCVVFIDEADAIFASRGETHRQSHRELINQFLKEWDGLSETTALVMLATNRPFDLDDAVLRRLPRKLLVDLPTRDDRAEILKLLLRGETLDDTVKIADLADRTPFYSGSDLKNMCVAAAMAAVEEENDIAAGHVGPEAYKFPTRRTLTLSHLEKGMGEIPASISEDMASLKQIKKFDEKYGQAARKSGRKKKKAIGFGVVDETVDTNQARIRGQM